MYTIVSAYGLEKPMSSQWKEFDVKALTPAEVSSTFQKLYITLLKNGLTDPVSVDYDSISTKIGFMPDDLETIFAGFGNEAMEFITVPRYTTEPVVFGEAFRLGYQVNSARPGSHYTSKALPGERTELQISRPDVNMENFSKHCVVMSNGYLYMHEYSNRTVFVPKAGYALTRSKRNNVGFLSFEKIGAVKQYRITPEMVSAPEGGKIADKCYISIPSTIDLTNKSMMIVIAGHLYFLGGVCSMVSPTLMKVRSELIPIMERFMASQGVIDYSAMKLSEESPDRIILEEFYGDTAMRNYIGHEQSFLIVVDTPRISYNKKYLKALPLPGRFISRQEPTAPLVTGLNQFSEYWKFYEDGEWLVTIPNPYIGNRNYSQMPYLNEVEGVGPENLPYRTHHNSRGFFLEILADKKA